MERILSHHTAALLSIDPQHKIRFLIGLECRGHDDVFSGWKFVTSAIFPRVDVLRRCRHRTVARKKLLPEIAALCFSESEVIDKYSELIHTKRTQLRTINS